MINLRIHSEFHFDFSDRGYGRIASIVNRVKELGQKAACLTDATTFGHVSWFAACKAAGIKPLLGAEVRCDTARLTLIARNNAGLKELYGLSSAAVSGALSVQALYDSSPNVIKLNGSLAPPKKLKKSKLAHWYADVSPSTPQELLTQKKASGLPLVAVSENRYPNITDKGAYALFGGSPENYPQHILSEREVRAYVKSLPPSALTLSDEIAETCSVNLPVAVNMTIKGDIEKLCRANIKARLGRWTKRYEERLLHELKMIHEKKFESYFLIISDMVVYAKKHMVVGPARGSSAGSLVCFLLYITDIDPIHHGLLFERFIDVTRADLPDIDLDFPPDPKREMVIQYLREKYGDDHVVHIGTVLTLQPKSILKLVGKRLDIKPWEFQPLLDVMVERASGDSRGELCLLDTLEGMDAGKAVLARFPQVRTATAFEGHAQTSGTHAAGIVVCAEPVNHFCTVNAESSTAQVDKVSAEALNLLKIDMLGLRTLAVLEHTIEQLPGKRIDLTKLPLDDAAVFNLFNEQRWAGIFQFEGDALQMLQKMIVVSEFADIVAIGALGRPGPLNSGGGQEWCDRRMGREGRLENLHQLCDEFTSGTYGIIVYQEQVMQIARKVGQLSWEDVTDIRKTMSKSKGEEYFNTYRVKFIAGAKKQGVPEAAASKVWGHLTTMGAWAFNKSHAVAYGLISYWCGWLKAHHPLEFACATLRHTKGEAQTINLLRELHAEKIKFVAFDVRTSRENWEVINGKLTGGFLNLKGFGETTAKKFVESRGKWTDKDEAKIEAAEVLYSNIYPAHERYAALYANPAKCGFPGVRKLWTMRDIDAALTAGENPSDFYFLGRLVSKVPRDLNEYVFQVKRVQDGRPKMMTHDTAYLNMVIEDDTGRRGMTVSAGVYAEVGRGITETGVVDKSWYVMRGRFNKIRHINVTWAKDVTAESWPEQ